MLTLAVRIDFSSANWSIGIKRGAIDIHGLITYSVTGSKETRDKKWRGIFTGHRYPRTLLLQLFARIQSEFPNEIVSNIPLGDGVLLRCQQRVCVYCRMLFSVGGQIYDLTKSSHLLITKCNPMNILSESR